MRVVSGSKRGMVLYEFNDDSVRPTLNRIKESMFDILQFSPWDEVVDLFAGTGQLGIEALSRGAQHAVFCDHAPEAVALIEKNVKKADFSDRARILLTDYKKFLKYQADRPYDVIFVDPPYREGLSQKALERIGSLDVLKKTGLVVLECAREETDFPSETGCLTLRRRYDYGTVSLLIYQRKDRDV